VAQDRQVAAFYKRGNEDFGATNSVEFLEELTKYKRPKQHSAYPKSHFSVVTASFDQSFCSKVLFSARWTQDPLQWKQKPFRDRPSINHQKNSHFC
jgi:hypothetical protein